MLESAIWILLLGFFSGQIVKRLGAPPLVGMVAVGIVLGPQLLDVLDDGVLAASDDLRAIAVMVILMKAGLGLDREKLAQQGTVALRLGFLPGVCEMLAIAAAAVWLLDFNIVTGLLLGCIIGAESPAVIVPGMLRLKRLGWGVEKGIPDAILTGSALSDVLLLLLFNLLLSVLSSASGALASGVSASGASVSEFSNAAITLFGRWSFSAAQLLPLQLIIQIVLGALLGWLSARALIGLLEIGKGTAQTQAVGGRQGITWGSVQVGLVSAGIALLLVVVSEKVPVFSGYLAVMAMGFFITELDTPLARRLRGSFSSLWVVAEIVLFVLLGASIELSVLEDVLVVGLVLLLIGTLVGRSLGWFLSTLGSNWTPPERLFLLPGNSAKATVQAAIGAVPLAMGIPGGDIILAISALSILITAPLGAWAIPTFAPKLLKRGTVDPTKITVDTSVLLLAAIDASPLSTKVLERTAAVARRCEGEVIALYVMEGNTKIEPIRKQVKQYLADVRYRFVVGEGEVAAAIVQNALNLGATEIVIGKRRDPLSKQQGGHLVGSAAKVVIGKSPLPVTVVEA